jgi:hypothetical protein
VIITDASIFQWCWLPDLASLPCCVKFSVFSYDSFHYRIWTQPSWNTNQRLMTLTNTAKNCFVTPKVRDLFITLYKPHVINCTKVYILCEPICVSLCLFHCTLCRQLVFDHTLMRKGSVGRSCRAIGSKILSCGMVHHGISRRVLGGTPCGPGHWAFCFYRRGFGLWLASLFPRCWRCCHMWEVAGSTPGLDF